MQDHFSERGQTKHKDALNRKSCKFRLAESNYKNKELEMNTIVPLTARLQLLKSMI